MKAWARWALAWVRLLVFDPPTKWSLCANTQCYRYRLYVQAMTPDWAADLSGHFGVFVKSVQDFVDGELVRLNATRYARACTC